MNLAKQSTTVRYYYDYDGRQYEVVSNANGHHLYIYSNSSRRFPYHADCSHTTKLGALKAMMKHASSNGTKIQKKK